MTVAVVADADRRQSGARERRNGVRSSVPGPRTTPNAALAAELPRTRRARAARRLPEAPLDYAFVSHACHSTIVTNLCQPPFWGNNDFSSSCPKSASFIGKAELVVPHSTTLRVASTLPTCRQVLECARASAALPLAHGHLYANTYTSFTIFQADATASKHFVSKPTWIRSVRHLKNGAT